MTELNNDVSSTLKLYNYKFFIDDVDLLEDFKKDLESLNSKFKNEIKKLYTSMIMEHEPMIRKLIIKLVRYRDKFRLRENTEFEFKSKIYTHCVMNKYFEISNYIEKLNIINMNIERSFIDVIFKELFCELKEFTNNTVNCFKNTCTTEPIVQSESILTYNSAVLKNLDDLEIILTEISSCFDLIKEKFDYYCDFISKIKDFDIKIMIKLHEKNKLYLYGLNKEYSIISSRSIIIQWLYCDIIINLYSILNTVISNTLIEFDEYLDYINNF